MRGRSLKFVWWQFVAWIPLALFLVSRHGCESREATREIMDGTGKNQLVLVALATRYPFSSLVEYDFDSLVWKTKAGTKWTDHRVIRKAAFQASRPTSRWVSDIHNFDSTSGTAIIKIGEESPPLITATGSYVTVQYSWREWDLNKNAQVRLLRVCQDPLEKYEK